MTGLVKKERVNSLTRRQVAFLSSYQEKLNFNEACEEAGYAAQTVRNMLRKDTTFTTTFRNMQKTLEQDPRFSKLAGIEKLLRYQKEAEELGDYKLALEMQKEINKMVAGNIAPTKNIEEKSEKVEIKVIDFTDRLKQMQPSNNTIKIDNYQDAEIVE